MSEMSKCGKIILDKKTLEEIFGKEKAKNIPPDMIKKWLEGAERISDAYDKGILPKHEVNKRLDVELNNLRETAEIKNQLKVSNEMASDFMRGYVRQEGFSNKPWEGFKAMLTKTYLKANGSKISVEHKIKSRQKMYIGFMEEAFLETGAFKELRSGVYDEQIYKAVHEMQNGKVLSDDTDPVVKKISEALIKTNDMMFKDMVDVKMPVKYKKSRATMQTHSTRKLRGVGRDEWVQKVKELNPDRQYLGTETLTDEGLTKVLGEMYDDILLGRHGEIDVDGGLSSVSDGDAASGTVGSSKLGARSLNFGPEQSFKYNKEFGTYDTLLQNLVSDINKTAQKTTIFEQLGDAPKKNLGKAIEREVARLLDEGKLAEAEKLKGERRPIMDQLARIMKTTSVPQNKAIADAEKIIAGFEVGSKLGNVGIRSFGNEANLIMAIRDTTGKNYFEAMVSSVLEMDFKDASVKTYSKKAGDFLKMMNQSMVQSVSGGVPGVATKLANAMMKYNGQDFINNLFEKSFTVTQFKNWGDGLKKGLDFDKLDGSTKTALLTAGVGKEEWSFFKHGLTELSDGTPFFDLDSIDINAPGVRDSIEAAMAFKGYKGTAEKFLKDTKLNVGSYLEQMSDFVTTSPGVREQASLLGDAQTGTWEGFTKSIVTRFKSFSVQAYLSTRGLANSKVDADLLARGIVKSSDDTDYASVAQFMITGMSLAYLADTLIRASQGKDPKDFMSAETAIDSLAKSSAGGLYMDMFSGEWDRYAFSSTLAGPTLGQLTPLASGVTNLRQGLTEKDAKKSRKGYTDAVEDTAKIVRSYVPFQQAVGVKLALDHVQYRMLKEALNPGSNARYDNEKMREKLKQKFLEARGE